MFYLAKVYVIVIFWCFLLRSIVETSSIANIIATWQLQRISLVLEAIFSYKALAYTLFCLFLLRQILIVFLCCFAETDQTASDKSKSNGKLRDFYCAPVVKFHLTVFFYLVGTKKKPCIIKIYYLISNFHYTRFNYVFSETSWISHSLDLCYRLSVQGCIDSESRATGISLNGSDSRLFDANRFCTGIISQRFFGTTTFCCEICAFSLRCFFFIFFAAAEFHSLSVSQSFKKFSLSA